MNELLWGVAYGPVASRRLGLSLGVNLLPPDRKVCTFNCTYCQFGWTRLEAGGKLPSASQWPTRESVAHEVTVALERCLASGGRPDRLTIAGHGEPTLHPDFPAVVRGLRAVRDRLAPDLPIAILSNSSTADRPAIRKALAEIDERHMKLDAGDDDLLHRLNGASMRLPKVLAGLKGLTDIHVQSMFVADRTGRLDNTHAVAVTAWLNAIVALKPRAVHLLTIHRPPAFPFLRAVPLDRLEAVARRVREAGIPAQAFG